MISRKDFFETLYFRPELEGVNSGRLYLGTQEHNQYNYEEKWSNESIFINFISPEEIDLKVKLNLTNRFFSPNVFSSKKNCWGKKRNHLIALTAFFLDLDCISAGVSLEECYREIDKMPIEPTAVVCSGNGFHVYWFLERPVFFTKKVKGKEYAKVLELYDNTLKAMQKKYAYLGADRTIKAHSYLRVPNTINSKPFKRVDSKPMTRTDYIDAEFGHNMDRFKGGEKKVEIIELIEDNLYDFNEFVRVFNPEHKKIADKKAKREQKALESIVEQDQSEQKEETKGKKGNAEFTIGTLAKHRVDDLITLLELRNGKTGTTPEGGYIARNDFLRLAVFFDPTRVHEINNNFEDVENASKIESIIEYQKQALETNEELKKLKNWKNETIIKTLNITPDEQKHLKTIIDEAEKLRRVNLKYEPIKQKNLAVKNLKILYVQKFQHKQTNAEMMKSIGIKAKSTIKIYKKANIDEIMTYNIVKQLAQESVKPTTKAVTKVLETKATIMDFTKKDYQNVINYLNKIA